MDNTFRQEKLFLRLTFKLPGLALIGFRTTRIIFENERRCRASDLSTPNRTGPITERSEDQNLALLVNVLPTTIFKGDLLPFLLTLHQTEEIAFRIECSA